MSRNGKIPKRNGLFYVYVMNRGQAQVHVACLARSLPIYSISLKFLPSTMTGSKISCTYS